MTQRLPMNACLLGLLLVPLHVTVAGAEDAPDAFQWLEEIESKKSLDWVKKQNKKSLSVLEKDPRYTVFLDEAKSILNAKDRIPYGQRRAGWVYNFWQDAKHVRGILRRAKPEAYRAKKTQWQTVLDIDALAATEKENWVYKGVTCAAPKFQRCMVRLSRGGKDASVYREFDVETRAFVDQGFEVAEAKTAVDWIDRDTLLIGTDFGTGTLTESGYPRIVKRWRRGTDIDRAETVFEGEPVDMGVWPMVVHRPEGTEVFVYRAPTFFTSSVIHVDAKGKQTKLPLQPSAKFKGLFQGQVLVSLREAWTPVGQDTYSAGSLISLSLRGLLDKKFDGIHRLFTPTERTSIQRVAALRDDVYISTLDNVRGRLIRSTRDAKAGTWTQTTIPLPQNGSVGFTASTAFENDIYIRFTDFITPDQLFDYRRGMSAPELIKTLPTRFNSLGVTVSQHQAKSADGTQVPYFLVKPKGFKADGSMPTLLYGYGGFEVSMTPQYMATFGKLWVERGGAFVIANIRGGGEFGPQWHRAAKKEKTATAFDDFLAVAEDLIRTKVTAPTRLGIMGGSNGGLLMGASFTQRPDLFGAVVCQVPLLDMIRYTKLLAGASWMDEYGDPSQPNMRAAILKYSPYHNLKADTSYPPVFFITSTKDDRVHPAHARKMAAKMASLSKPFWYFENIEGGHSASANRNQRAQRTALEFVYLWKQLGAKSSTKLKAKKNQ